MDFTCTSLEITPNRSCLDLQGPAWVAAAALSLSIFSIFFIVDVLLKAVGDTPIMKTKKWAVDRGRTVQSLAQFISRFLKLDANEQLVRMKFVHSFIS